MTAGADRRPVITGRIDDYNRHHLAAVAHHCVRCNEPVMLSPRCRGQVRRSRSAAGPR